MNPRQFVEMVARMTLEDEYDEGDAPPSEDWICTLNELIETARECESEAHLADLCGSEGEK